MMATWGHGRSVESIRAAEDWLTGQHFVGRYLERRAVVRLERGNVPLAEAALERAVACAREASDWLLAMRALARLVALAKGHGRWRRAEVLTRELLAVAEESRSAHVLGIALRMRGELLSDPRYLEEIRAIRPPAEARVAFEASIAALEEDADVVELLITFRAFACCLMSQERTDDALRLVRRAKRLLAH